MLQNVVKRGYNNPVILIFGLRGEFAAQGLLAFDYIDLIIGGEFYSTVNTPENLFINSDDPFELRLRIGTTTNLKPNSYKPTIKGFNLTYPNGYILNDPQIDLLESIRVV